MDSSPNQNPYDILIVGAGLAGLHCALRLAKAYPKKTIAVAEAYNYLGGRVVTYWTKSKSRALAGLHWENGAGRIHKSHTMVMDYLTKYNLSLTPLSSEAQWTSQGGKESYANNWPQLATLLHEILRNLRPALLQTHTVAGILKKSLGEEKTMAILNHFPYRAEMFVMRADLALESLSQEMGDDQDFFVVQEGLSAFVDEMVDECERLGVEFLMGHKCYGVTQDAAHFKVKDTQADKILKKSIPAKKIILSLHSRALRHIHPFANLPILRKLIMCPLLRIYAVFPVKDGRSWFSDLPRTVTDSPLRYIIPVNPARGVIMISYTDAQDTLPWTRILDSRGPDALQEEVLAEARRLFPDRHIPKPLFFKAHPWSEGCTYWAPGPGLYSPEEESRKVMHPLSQLPNVYICGESFSLRQCWMEGALEHSEAMLKRYFF